LRRTWKCALLLSFSNLAFGAFYEAIVLLTFCEIINILAWRRV